MTGSRRRQNSRNDCRIMCLVLIGSARQDVDNGGVIADVDHAVQVRITSFFISVFVIFGKGRKKTSDLRL